MAKFLSRRTRPFPRSLYLPRRSLSISASLRPFRLCLVAELLGSVLALLHCASIANDGIKNIIFLTRERLTRRQARRNLIDVYLFFLELCSEINMKKRNSESCGSRSALNLLNWKGNFHKSLFLHHMSDVDRVAHVVSIWPGYRL